jgi:hypothetical protein
MRIRISLEIFAWIRIKIRKENKNNTDPQHWLPVEYGNAYGMLYLFLKSAICYYNGTFTNKIR